MGCGPGYFIDSIKGDVLNVVGIEKNIQERAYLNEQLNIICYEQISDLSPDTKFDLIVLNQVLEHVYNPVNFLRELYGLIDKNGVFVIEVPSSSNSLVSLYNNNSFRNFWFQEPHLWYFDMNTLKEVIKKTFGNECIYSLRVFQETSFVNHYEWIVHNNKSISRDQALSKEFPLACLEDDVKDELDSLFISFNEQYQELLEKNNYGDILLATVKIK